MTRDLTYRLIVLTHGAESAQLDQALQAFRSHVDVPPSSAYMHPDGNDASVKAYAAVSRHDWTDWTIGGTYEPQGFCKATRECWWEGAAAPEQYVFWLEHDFLIERHLSILKMASVLNINRTMAQMQLMREAVSPAEIEAGGLFESRPDQYTPVDLDFMVHRSYLTTNPNLMRSEFMRENPWPSYDDQCEGRFGIDLVQAGYRFGVWGDGKPWCRHIGERTGFGY